MRACAIAARRRPPRHCFANRATVATPQSFAMCRCSTGRSRQQHRRTRARSFRVTPRRFPRRCAREQVTEARRPSPCVISIMGHRRRRARCHPTIWSIEMGLFACIRRAGPVMQDDLLSFQSMIDARVGRRSGVRPPSVCAKRRGDSRHHSGAQRRRGQMSRLPAYFGSSRPPLDLQIDGNPFPSNTAVLTGNPPVFATCGSSPVPSGALR